MQPGAPVATREGSPGGAQWESEWQGTESGHALHCPGTLCSLVSLVRHVSDAKVAEMSSALMTRLTTGKDPQRDIASIALRTLIQETPAGPSAHALAAVLPSKLLQGISSQVGSPVGFSGSFGAPAVCFCRRG